MITTVIISTDIYIFGISGKKFVENIPTPVMELRHSMDEHFHFDEALSKLQQLVTSSPQNGAFHSIFTDLESLTKSITGFIINLSFSNGL